MELEIKVINGATGRDIMDLDPINVRVAYENRSSGYRLADRTDGNLIRLWDAAEEWLIDASLDLPLVIVWSDDNHAVKAECASCENPFPVSDDMIPQGDRLLCVDCFEHEGQNS